VAESILTSTKKILGLDVSYTVFDLDILTHINSAFSTLNQLGIGPEDGFAIVDATATWDAFIGSNLKYNSVKTYVYLKVRLVFDPPQTSYLIESLAKQAHELEWRLNAVREETEWVDPDPAPITDTVLDGGEP
jgi:hypothetical protein